MRELAGVLEGCSACDLHRVRGQQPLHHLRVVPLRKVKARGCMRVHVSRPGCGSGTEHEKFRKFRKFRLRRIGRACD